MIDWRAPALNDAIGGRIAAILDAALAAVDPGAAVARALQGHVLLAAPARSLRVVAIGKAAPAMATAIHTALGERIRDGIVVGKTHVPPQLGPLRGLTGGHPIPNADSVRAGRAVYELARSTGPDDTLVLALSGGASALVTLPDAGLTLEDLAATTEALLRSGVDIDGINAVRKHLDRLKGGRLAQRCAPARIVALVLSDVVGDAPATIGSGPVTGDPSTWHDAARALAGLDVPARVQAAVREGIAGQRQETPSPDDPIVTRVEHQIIASNTHARDAAAERARQLGYRTELGPTLLGEAAAIGDALGHQLASLPSDAPICIVAGGETTVTVRGHGHGGRNQELALAAVLPLAQAREHPSARRLVTLATDGEDGPTDAAGAVVTPTTAAQAHAAGLAVPEHLARNDAYALLDRLDALLRPGPTGTNVGDLAVTLVDPR